MIKKPLALVVAAVTVSALLGASSPSSHAEPTVAAQPASHRDARAADYPWVGRYSPADSYSLTVVRGIGPAAVKRALAPLGERVGDATPTQAMMQVFDDDFEMVADFVQISRRGSAVVVWEPYGYRASDALERLSRRGVAFNFGTFPGENYVSIYREGKWVRSFEPPFSLWPAEALPIEKGLRFKGTRGSVHRNVWALMERAARVHISQRWFEGEHPTWVRPYR